MKSSVSGLLLAVATATMVAGCGFTVMTRSVSPSRELRQEFGKLPTVGRDQAATQLAQMVQLAGSDPAKLKDAAIFAMAAGNDVRHRDSQKALGFFVSATELGLSAAEHSEGENRFEVADAALLQVLTLPDDPKSLGPTVETPLGLRSLSLASVPGVPTFDRLIASPLVRMTGFTCRVEIPGLGVPMVGVLRDSEISFYERRGTYSPVTAVPRMAGSGGKAGLRVEIVDSRMETVNFDGSDVPLAADYTAPIAKSYDRLNDLALGVKGLLFIGNQMKLAGLYMLEPYDPDRIPVLMVHGLSSSPLIWRNMINELQIDPVIRERYQFWVVYYPSGVPILRSAQFLREQMADIRKTFDPEGYDLASRELVTMGHSMGGVITRMNAIEIGDHLWNEISDKPFADLNLDDDDRAELEERIFWKPIPTMHRSIYFSAPHRGATMADSSLANFGMRLIRFPGDVFRFQKRMLETLGGFLVLDFDVSKLFNSIGSLSPSNPIYAALDASEFKPDFKYDTVVGDRGRGDTPDSSDGIVGYWSSHLDGAEDELIVPTGHESFTHPDAIRFTGEILREHERSVPQP